MYFFLFQQSQIGLRINAGLPAEVKVDSGERGLTKLLALLKTSKQYPAFFSPGVDISLISSIP